MAGIALTANRIRFAVNAANPFAGNVNDAITGSAISLPSGAALNFELLFYFGTLADVNLLDLTQYTKIVIQLGSNSSPHAGTIYYQGNVLAASFNNAATVAAWTGAGAAGNTAQAQLFVPSAQNVVPAGATNYWITIYAVSTDLAQDDILLFAGKITGQDSGINTGAAPALSTLPTTRGAQALAAGTANGTIALNLAYIPTAVILTLQGPDANALNLVCTVTAITALSFNFNLSAGTDRAGYVLNWIALQ